MRVKNTLTIAMLLILAITSCVSCAKSADSGRGAEELVLEVRTDFLKAEKLTVTADITADYGDRVYEFKVKYAGNAEAGTLTILGPEQIAGIEAEVTLEGCVLVYDGARLDMGALTQGGLSPAEALPTLIAAWQSGNIESCEYEKLGDTDTASVTTSIGDTASQKTWFDIKTRLPVRAEISDSGVMVVACVFKDVAVE